MCRNIRVLFHFEPPASDDELRAASLQLVRKLSGMKAPSKANVAAFESAVEEVPMAVNLVARASITIEAPLSKVWDALVDPHMIKQYMFGTTTTSDWRTGSPIAWKGEWKGKAYEDKGVILAFEPRSRLRYSHFSPLSGLPDAPESYHTVTIDLSQEAGLTRVSLSQDNNTTEEARDHSEQNWRAVLDSMKRLLEA